MADRLFHWEYEELPVERQAFRVTGGRPLRGKVQISGSKNAALKMLAERWSIPAGSVRMPATRSVILTPSSIPPPPGFAPWPITISSASARRRSSGFRP